MVTELRVTSQTNLQDLQAFLDKAGDGAKIRAREQDGTVTLYASPKKHGLFNWLTSLFGPSRQDKREAGERAIGTIIKQSSDLSTGTKDKLVRNIMGEAPRTDKGKELRTEGLRQIVESANRELDTHISFNGKDYTRGKQLGADGQGIVHLYTPLDGGDPIVVKHGAPPAMLRDDPDAWKEAGDDLRKEIDIHRHITDSGKHPNVLPMLGELTGRKGEPVMILPLAPHGDAYDLSGKLWESTTLSGSDRKDIGYAMLKDIGSSLQHLHGQSGVLHLDMKLENYLIDGKGNLQLSDFGTSMKGLDHSVQKYPVMKNNNVPPEVALVRARKDDTGKIDSQIRLLTREIGELDRAGKTQEAGDKRLELRELHAKKKEIANEPVPVNTKTDSWVLGLSAMKLLVNPGKDGNPFVVSGNFDNKTVDRLLEFKDSNKTMLQQVKDWYPDDVALHERIDSLTPSEKSLINGLLDPDPGKRMPLDEAMKSELLVGAGGDDVRRKLVELTGK
jgi:serine/threonine protein kinase